MDVGDDDREVPHELNLRVFPPLLILSAETICWNCKQPMKAVAAGAYAVEDDGEKMGDVEDTSDMFVLSDVGAMPDEVLQELVRRNPNFERRHSRTAGSVYYANACPACTRITGDFYLHMEPGGPFFPTTVDEAAAITVERVSFPQPLLFGGTWGHGTGDFILSHAKVVDVSRDDTASA